MKKKLIATVFILLTIILVMVMVNTPDAGTSQPNNSVPNAQDITPTPIGEINVPAFSIKIFAPGPNPLANTVDAYNHVSGFLIGIWHGITSLITLVMSLFNTNMQMYEVHNDGFPYNLGFLIGVAIIFLILGMFVGLRRRRY
jgi:hypothetical protein